MNKVAILVGGSGSRLGGSDKGLVKIGGMPLIERIMSNLKGYDTVIVCRDKSQQKYYAHYSQLIEDEFTGMGPLAGIHAALKYFRQSILVLGVDMPLIRKEVLDVLFREFGDEEALIPVWEDGKTEPLLACYNHNIVERIEGSLKKGERKILNALNMDRVKLYPVERLRKVDKELISLMNINTPEDLKRAEEICSQIDLGERLPT